MNNTSSASNLPAIPTTSVITAQKDGFIQRKTNAVRRLATEYSLNDQWRVMATIASQDPELTGYNCPIVFPANCSTALLNRTTYSLQELGNDGRWIYCRLHYLVGTVLAVLDGVDDSHTLASVRASLEESQDLLLWEAAGDLILARKIIEAEKYNPVRSLLSPTLRPLAIDGVAELRGRVLYIIEALELIYKQMLQCERMRRSQQQTRITDELQAAVTWFETFREIAENMRRQDEGASSAPSNQRRWWKRQR